MNINLWNLCQREALLTLRDQARKEARLGNPQAIHVAAWLERVLTTHEYGVGMTRPRRPVTPAPEEPEPRRFRLRPPRLMRMQ